MTLGTQLRQLEGNTGVAVGKRTMSGLFPLFARSVSVSGDRSAQMRAMVDKIRWYPFNLCFCNFFATIQKILGYGFNINPMGLDLITMFTINSLGLFDSIAYFSLPIVRHAWSRYLYHLTQRHPWTGYAVCCCCCCYHGTKKSTAASGEGEMVSVQSSRALAESTNPMNREVARSSLVQTEYKDSPLTTMSEGIASLFVPYLQNDVIEESLDHEEEPLSGTTRAVPARTPYNDEHSVNVI